MSSAAFDAKSVSAAADTAAGSATAAVPTRAQRVSETAAAVADATECFPVELARVVAEYTARHSASAPHRHSVRAHVSRGADDDVPVCRSLLPWSAVVWSKAHRSSGRFDWTGDRCVVLRDDPGPHKWRSSWACVVGAAPFSECESRFAVRLSYPERARATAGHLEPMGCVVGVARPNVFVGYASTDLRSWGVLTGHPAGMIASRGMCTSAPHAPPRTAIERKGLELGPEGAVVTVTVDLSTATREQFAGCGTVCFRLNGHRFGPRHLLRDIERLEQCVPFASAGSAGTILELVDPPPPADGEDDGEEGSGSQ
jgi:hypothetical protein